LSSENKFGMTVGMVFVALPLAAFLVWQFDQGSTAVHTLAHEVKQMFYLLLAGVLVLGAILALGWAARENIRAWRSNEHVPPERITVRETKIIEREGRLPTPPQIYTLPPAPNHAGLFPEMVRGWQAGQAQLPGQPAALAQIGGPSPWDAPTITAPDEAEPFGVFQPEEHWH